MTLNAGGFSHGVWLAGTRLEGSGDSSNTFVAGIPVNDHSNHNNKLWVWPALSSLRKTV